MKVLAAIFLLVMMGSCNDTSITATKIDSLQKKVDTTIDKVTDSVKAKYNRLEDKIEKKIDALKDSSKKDSTW